jgi:hypothetical protein
MLLDSMQEILPKRRQTGKGRFVISEVPAAKPRLKTTQGAALYVYSAFKTDLTGTRVAGWIAGD